MKRGFIIIGLVLALLCATYAVTWAFSCSNNNSTGSGSANGSAADSSELDWNAAFEEKLSAKSTGVYGPQNCSQNNAGQGSGNSISNELTGSGNYPVPLNGGDNYITADCSDNSCSVTVTNGSATAESAVTVNTDYSCTAGGADCSASETIIVNSSSSASTSPATVSVTSPPVNPDLPPIPPVDQWSQSTSNATSQEQRSQQSLSMSANQEPAKIVNVLFMPESADCRIHNKLRVVVLSSPAFDATTINVDTVLLAGEHPESIRQRFADLNFDGLPDIFMYFNLQDINPKPGEGKAFLCGATATGEKFKSNKGI